MKYKKNLKVTLDGIYSYKTKVANIEHGEGYVIQLGYWSVTTQKHINHAVNELGLQLIKAY